jgi:hypothetical protein
MCKSDPVRQNKAGTVVCKCCKGTDRYMQVKAEAQRQADTSEERRRDRAAQRCRKCGGVLSSGELAFGSKATGWEHPFSCPT